MMLSMHSMLRDRLEKRTALVDVLLLIMSAVLAARLFVDPKLLSQVGISPEAGDTIARLCSVGVFTVSLVMLRLDLRGKAGSFKQSAEALGKLKAELTSVASNPNATPDQIADVMRSSRVILNGLPKIPDKLFLPLKAAHLRKLRLSRLLDLNPCCPVTYLKMRLWVHGLKSASLEADSPSPE